MKYVVMSLFGFIVGSACAFFFHPQIIVTVLISFFSPFFAKYVYETLFK